MYRIHCVHNHSDLGQVWMNYCKAAFIAPDPSQLKYSTGWLESGRVLWTGLNATAQNVGCRPTTAAAILLRLLSYDLHALALRNADIICSKNTRTGVTTMYELVQLRSESMESYKTVRYHCRDSSISLWGWHRAVICQHTKLFLLLLEAIIRVPYHIHRRSFGSEIRRRYRGQIYKRS